MSLINDMLKDLEARGDRDGAVVGARATTGAPRSGHRGWLIALAALVVVLAAALAFVMTRDATPPADAVAARSVSTQLAVAQAAPQPVVETVPVAAKQPPVVAVVPQLQPVEVAAPALPAATLAPVESRGAPEADVAEEGSEPAGTMIVRRHEPTQAEVRARASREGFAALKRADWLTASRLLGELVALEPANDDAREGLAVALVQQGRIAEADGVLLDGLAVGAQPARFAKLRARVQAAQGDLAGALQSLSVAVPAVAADPEFHALRGALAQQSGDHALALDVYRQLTAFAPANGTWQAGLAMALDASGDAAGASEAYARALEAGGLEPALLEHARRRREALHP